MHAFAELRCRSCLYSALTAMRNGCSELSPNWQRHVHAQLLSQNYGAFKKWFQFFVVHLPVAIVLCLLLLSVVNSHVCLQIERQRCCNGWSLWSYEEASSSRLASYIIICLFTKRDLLDQTCKISAHPLYIWRPLCKTQLTIRLESRRALCTRWEWGWLSQGWYRWHFQDCTHDLQWGGQRRGGYLCCVVLTFGPKP